MSEGSLIKWFIVESWTPFSLCLFIANRSDIYGHDHVPIVLVFSCVVFFYVFVLYM